MVSSGSDALDGPVWATYKSYEQDQNVGGTCLPGLRAGISSVVFQPCCDHYCGLYFDFGAGCNGLEYIFGVHTLHLPGSRGFLRAWCIHPGGFLSGLERPWRLSSSTSASARRAGDGYMRLSFGMGCFENQSLYLHSDYHRHFYNCRSDPQSLEWHDHGFEPAISSHPSLERRCVQSPLLLFSPCATTACSQRFLVDTRVKIWAWSPGNS